MSANINCVGYEEVSVTDSAVGLTVPTAAHRAIIKCAVADVRLREDGTDPTSSVGVPLANGDIAKYMDHNWQSALGAVKFIRTGGTSATLHVHYYD